MSTRRIHWRPSGYSAPRARCGAWYGTAQVTRDEQKVTCGKCRNFLIQAQLSLEAVRGRLLVIELRDDDAARGTLIAASAAGLQVCRGPGREPQLIRWTRITSFDFVDHDASDSGDGAEEMPDVH